jgi:predicted PhzF superfamily epimerase YddE/YHI9
MRAKYYLVDTFTTRRFGGNPAAVCVLDAPLPDADLVAVAAEIAQPVMAFLLPDGDRAGIRFFTPQQELAMVGHATMGAAYVALCRLRPARDSIRFAAPLAGTLTATRDGPWVEITLPRKPAAPCAPPRGLAAALGASPREVLDTSQRYMAVFEREAEIQSMAPDMQALAALDRSAVIVTAPGSKAAFVSRVFAPQEGLPEDPVCGSAHCTLIPFWSARLGQERMDALQISPRCGELRCRLLPEAVGLAGRCAPVMRGTILI